MISRTHRSRLLAPLAVAAALTLGACGASDDSATDTVPSAESGDASSSSSSDDGGLLAPRAVHTAGGGAAMSATAEAAPSADGRMVGDMMAPYRITTFVAGDGLELPTNDTGWGFEVGATVSEEQVASLAAALGVEGAPERIDDGYTVYWRVGPDDGSAPSLTVYEDAQLSWSYNGPWDAVSVGGGCAVAEPGVIVEEVVPDADPSTDAAVVVDPCEAAQPEPPAGVPTQDEATAKAQELLTSLGLDPATYEFETYADEWFASVTGTEQLGGTFAGRSVSIGYGAEGVLQYAGGQLAEPAQVGPYPLVDIETALARLNDTSGFYGMSMPGLGVADVARVESTPSLDAPVSDVAVAGEPGAAPDMPIPVDSMPPVSMPAPEEVTVTLTGVEADVWWAYDVDGSVWLLPAYRFTGDDGGTYTVPAVTDEFLIQVPSDAVPVPEPMPVESIPLVTDVAPPATKPETLPTESIPGEPVPFDASQLEGSVGQTLADFTADAEALGASVRVTEIDGVPQPATMDYSLTRVNVAVEGDTVTAIVNVG